MDRYFIGECRWCEGQGVLAFWTEEQNDNVFVACDECSATYDTPEEAIKSINMDKTNFGLSRFSTLEEIIKVNLGWENYICGKYTC